MNEIKNKIFDELIALAPKTLTAENAALIEKIMKLIDEYVESEVVKARLQVMKNFKAI